MTPNAAKRTTDALLPFDLTQNLRNCWLLCEAIGVRRPASSAELKEQYGHAINSLHGSHVPFDKESILVTFHNRVVIDEMATQGLVVLDESRLDRYSLSASEQAVALSKLADTLDFIRAVVPDVHCLISNLIGTIVFLKQDGQAGGSVSSLTGLIWLNPSPDSTVVDYAVALVHEYVHNTIFLQDAVHGIFAYPIDFEAPEFAVRSALLKVLRPYDKSFHSAVVALCLHRFLMSANQYDMAKQVVADLGATIAGLQEKGDAALAPAGRALLGSVVEGFTSLELR